MPRAPRRPRRLDNVELDLQIGKVFAVRQRLVRGVAEKRKDKTDSTPIARRRIYLAQKARLSGARLDHRFVRLQLDDQITGLLDEWTPKGAFDFEEFASYFPITVMCRLTGASPEAIDTTALAALM